MSHDDNTRTVSRDIPATIVPYGNQIVIPAGTSVTITHRLGGNFTVTWEGGMAQVTGRYADALGEAVETPVVEPAPGRSRRSPSGPPSSRSSTPRSRSTSSTSA